MDNVEKSFRLPTEQASGVKQLLINWTKGIKGYREQQVLRGVSFEVRQGDFFGIVGRNGSGKSTLLKLISQIYVPECGSITVDGKLVPFIELGVGFNPELTGRENVYLNGALLGFSRTEIDAMYDDIVDFAELHDFMDQKLKNYSSGMQVRLAFSVAIKAQGDILVLDEVLAVGDEAFQRKCDNFFASVKKDPTKTVILVTHSMDAVKKYCNKAILIKDGKIVASGDKDDVADRYSIENVASSDRELSPDGYEVGLNKTVRNLSIVPESPIITNGRDPFVFSVKYDVRDLDTFYLAIMLHDLKRGGMPFYSDDIPMGVSGAGVARFSLPLDALNPGQYKLVAYVRKLVDGASPEYPDTEFVGFTNDARSCAFIIRNPELNSYALLTKSALALERLD
ncbi:MAG: ABC transporter ATP-binding protein [Coriobacteriaceae bacterium]|nr:ABC transporter ATP-binding protein [Coriobacteriaceae bacterium]